MSERGWKKRERRIAGKFGGKRIPVTGERDGADVLTPLFCVQVKCRKSYPQTVEKGLQSIERFAAQDPEHRIPILVWAKPHQKDGEALVILRLKHWRDLHG